MDTTHLIERLLRLPAEIEAAGATLLAADAQVEQARSGLRMAEAHLVVAGIEGKNQQERDARLTLALADYRQRVERAEAAKATAAQRYQALRDELSARRAVARLLSGRGDDE